MAIQYYDSKSLTFNEETIILADELWAISKLKTPEAFQRHYLSKRGNTHEEITRLLPKLRGRDFNHYYPRN